MFDFNKVKEQIHEEATVENVYIVTENDHFIEFVDEFAFSRPTLFTDPKIMDEAWFRDRFWVHPNVKDFPLEVAVSMLPFLDKDMLVNLRHVVVLNSPADLEQYVKDQFDDADYDEFTDMLPDTDDGIIGQFWFYGSCTLLFMDAIRQCIHEFEGHEIYETEFLFGVLGTLAHEIYHLDESNTFNESTLKFSDTSGDERFEDSYWGDFNDSEAMAEHYAHWCCDHFMHKYLTMKSN